MVIELTTVLEIIPPIIAAVVTYIIASKKAKIQYAKMMTDIQSKAIQTVVSEEEKMRKEIWEELKIVRKENEFLRLEISEINKKLYNSGELVETLREEIAVLKSSIAVYKEELNRKDKRITELETI